MTSKCYQKYNENLQKEATERYQNVLKKKKTKGKKGSEKDIKILLKKTKKEASIFSRT